MFYERHERYVWKKKIYFDACCITFRTALAYQYKRDDFEGMRLVGIVFRKVWDLRAELVPRKDAMTFIVAGMPLRVECGTKRTKARNIKPQRSSQLHSSDSNMKWDEKISEISFNSTYRTIQTPMPANTPSCSSQATFLFSNSVTTVPSLKLALVSTHSNFPNFGQTTLQTSHHVPPTTNTVIPTIGYNQYGRLVSPLPPGGRRNGAVSRKPCAMRKKKGTIIQVLKGRWRSGQV
jgi:hypothetical protein